LKIPADAITTPIVSQSKFSLLSGSASLLDCIFSVSFALFIFRLLRLIKIFQLLFALPIRQFASSLVVVIRVAGICCIIFFFGNFSTIFSAVLFCEMFILFCLAGP